MTSEADEVEVAPSAVRLDSEQWNVVRAELYAIKVAVTALAALAFLVLLAGVLLTAFSGGSN